MTNPREIVLEAFGAVGISEVNEGTLAILGGEIEDCRVNADIAIDIAQERALVAIGRFQNLYLALSEPELGGPEVFGQAKGLVEAYLQEIDRLPVTK